MSLVVPSIHWRGGEEYPDQAILYLGGLGTDMSTTISMSKLPKHRYGTVDYPGETIDKIVKMF